MNNYWDKYPLVKKDLEAVEAVLIDNMKCKDKNIEKSLIDMIYAGGKLLRPAFLLLSGRFGKFNERKLYSFAATIEILHMATLVHDDVIDKSELRRGVKTIYAEHGSSDAVFVGDLLLSRCFLLLSKKTNMDNMRMISQIMVRICEGEIDQNSAHYKLDSTVKQYLKRIATKTSALFALSFTIGASETKCSKKLTKELGRIGYNIGMAFQIIDDILDYEGSEAMVGKPLGNDLKYGIYTLPLIYAIKEKDQALAAVLETKNYSEDDIKFIINKTVQLGGMDRARDLARRYTNRAFDGIEALPNCESKEILKEVVRTLLIREY
jgi:heptaprenyl diphosphate synthase